MIECSDKTFRLLTDHTAYLFRVTAFGHVEHLHYGGTVPMADGAALAAKAAIARGSSTFPSFTISLSLLKFMSPESMMPSKHLILCRPLRLLP